MSEALGVVRAVLIQPDFPRPHGWTHSAAAVLRRGAGRAAVWILYAALALGSIGCGVLKQETVATKSVFQSLTGGNPTSATNAAALLQSEVMREADEYVAIIAQATDDFRVQVPTPVAREMGLQWKLLNATAAYVNATGEHPALNAVDMVVLATLSREVVESYWVGEKFGRAAEPLLAAHRRCESNAWSVAGTILGASQDTDLHRLLQEYREQHPNMRYVGATRLPELAQTLGKNPLPNQSQKPGSVFSLLYLDPFSGLDPAAQAIEETRNLAERAMYYAQRAPMLLGWQVELTTYQLAAQPETRQVLSNANSVAVSTESFAKVAIGLPELVNQQREAGINQILAGLARERSNIVATLSAQEGQLRELLPQVRQTLDAGNGMASSVNSAVKSLDAFVRYVNPPDTNAVAPKPAGKPFDVLDYGKAATDIGSMAKELNGLLTAVNQNLPQVTRLSEQAQTQAREAVDHAFRRGLILIAVAGLVACGVVILHHRLKRSGGH